MSPALRIVVKDLCGCDEFKELGMRGLWLDMWMTGHCVNDGSQNLEVVRKDPWEVNQTSCITVYVNTEADVGFSLLELWYLHSLWMSIKVSHAKINS